MTTRLTNPENGVTVSVDDGYGKELQGLGWKPADAPAEKPKATRRTSTKASADEDK